MTTLFLKAQGTETPIALPPGLHTAGGSPRDTIRLAGAPGQLMEFDVALDTTIVAARVPGCALGGRELKVSERWLLRPGQVLEIHGNQLRVESAAPAKASPMDQGTAAIARGVLGSAGVAAASPLPSLVWLNGRDCGKRLTLLDEATFLGRGDGTAARVRDALASRTHAKLTLRDGTATLKHLASANGLVVDGKAVDAETRVFGGEVIRIGETELLFDAALPRPQPSPAQPLPATLPTTTPKAEQLPGKPWKLPVMELALVGGASAAGALLTAAIWMLAR
ncbi:MAG TPA: FHA domain-containing protein [Myxococcales bacterium]